MNTFESPAPSSEGKIERINEIEEKLKFLRNEQERLQKAKEQYPANEGLEVELGSDEHVSRGWDEQIMENIQEISDLEVELEKLQQ